MKHLNFKNYPPKVLITLVLLISATVIFLKQLIYSQSFNWEIYAMMLLTVSAVSAIFYLINKFIMWKWFLKLLGLIDIRGKYAGELISSFHENDDPDRPNIKMKIEIKISQNINGTKIFGKVSPSKGKESNTSDFESEWVNLQSLENGNYLLEYRYSNRSNINHSWHKKYNLTSHTGFASLEFYPKEKTLKGIYFTYENKSNGNLILTIKK